MKKKFFILLAYCLPALSLFAQYNFGFEEFKPGSDTLVAWNRKDGQKSAGGLLRIDKEVKHSGTYALSIERNQTDTATKFTPVSVWIKSDFEGQRITASCWMKTENVANSAQMWLRIDDAAGNMLSILNYPSIALKGTTDWKEYINTVNLPADAALIAFGFLLVGEGKVWGDDFNLLVDGKPLDKVARIQKPQDKATLDNKEFVKASGVSLMNPDAFQVESLSLLGKVWGFLKYYHPYITKGNLNWDYELFRFLPRYLEVKNKEQRNKALLEWTNNLGKPAECKSCNDDVLNDATLKPDLEWINDKTQLNDSLILALNYIKNNRSRGKQYYMDLVPGVQNPAIVHEAAYNQFTYPDAGYRLLCLFRYWNLIQYWFPNRHLIGEDWKGVLTEFIPKMMKAKDATEYALTTQQLIARVHDTHANVWGTNKALEEWKGKYYPPVKLTFIDNQPVVSKIIVPDLAEASNLMVGDVIQSVNGKKIQDIIAEKLPNLPASNYPTQLRDLAALLLRSSDSVSTVTVLRNNKLIQTNLIRTIPAQIRDWYQADFAYQKDSGFFFIKPGIGYINLGKIMKKQVDSVFEALKGSKGLIIDNRQYPGDFAIYEIANELLPEKTPFTNIPVGRLDYPGTFQPKEPLYAGKKNKNYYKGKVVILVNENTQSSGEFHSMAFRIAPQAIVAGSTTAGADGNVSGFYLPGGIYTMFSGIGILYPDGTETQRLGIVPDVEIKRTIQGIKEEKDELVEKSVELINNEKNEFKPKGKKAF